ncbi:MAG: TetR/AcrR family transcriptional regulator, partial [Caldilineaceae bacterium]
VTWEYAFVYRELPSLIRGDPVLAATYTAVRARGYEGFFELIAALAATGVLLPGIDDATTTLLADLLWLLTEQWLTGLELQGLSANEVTIQRGIDLMMLVLRPYLA